jgi:hypothetical protein
MKALSRVSHGMIRNKMAGGRRAQLTNQYRAALAIAARLCFMAPASRVARRGCRATRALAFVFGALWLLALASSLQL